MQTTGRMVAKHISPTLATSGKQYVLKSQNLPVFPVIVIEMIVP